MEVPKADLCRTNTGTDAGPDGVPDGTDGLSLLIDGAKDSGCSEKAIYLSLGLPDHSYWSKVKTREKPEPRIRTLTNLPVEVQRAICTRWARMLGLKVSTENAQQQAAINLVKAAADFLSESA